MHAPGISYRRGELFRFRCAQKKSEEDRKGASSTATIIGLATFGIGGLFGHNFAHGRQKTIDENTIMNAFVADIVHVAASEAAIPPHYDHSQTPSEEVRGAQKS